MYWLIYPLPSFESHSVVFIIRISGFLRTHLLSHVQLFATPWTVACQASLSMGFFRQEYWSGLPFPPPGDLPDQKIEPVSPSLAGRFFTTEPPGKPTTECISLKTNSSGKCSRLLFVLS